MPPPQKARKEVKKVALNLLGVFHRRGGRVDLLTARKRRDGFYDFYWNKQNITALWMDFFSGLSSEQESRCVSIFNRRYAKKLNAPTP